MEPTLSRLRYNTGLRVEFAQIQNLKEYQNSNNTTCPPISSTASGVNKKIDKNTILFTQYDKYIDDENAVKPLYFIRGTIFSDYVYNVYKKTPQQAYYRYLCTLGSNNNVAFRDFNLKNKESYQYMVVIQRKIKEGSEETASEFSVYETRDYDGNSIYIPTNWNRWSITNIVDTTEDNVYAQSGEVWLLGMNLNDEQITQNISAVSKDTLGRYPRISRGEKNYSSSSYNGLLGDVEQYYELGLDGKVDPTSVETKYSERNYDTAMLWGTKVFIKNEFSHQLDKFRAWEKFCADGELKLLKDIKGNAWVVQIVDNPTRRINSKALDAYTTINFNWQEVANIDEVSIVAEGADID